MSLHQSIFWLWTFLTCLLIWICAHFCIQAFPWDAQGEVCCQESLLKFAVSEAFLDSLCTHVLSISLLNPAFRINLEDKIIGFFYTKYACQVQIWDICAGLH